MRAWDGSIFEVDWAFVEDESATTLPFVHPFVSGRDDPLGHEDLGYVGEIPVLYGPASNQKVPDDICSNCYQGPPEWWNAGWPHDAAPIVLDADGWPVSCHKVPMPVTLVGLQMPGEFVVAGSPVTTSGYFMVTWGPEPAHTFLAAPVGGGVPSFRTIQSSDLPPITGGTGLVNTVTWYQASPPAGPGLPTIGSYTLLDGETIYVDTGTNSVDAGPWEVHTGAWTRPSWFAVGATFTGFFIVNVLATRGNMAGDGEPGLFQLSHNKVGDVYAPWVVGTDTLFSTKVGTGGFTVTGGPGITTTPGVAQPTNFPGSVQVSLDPTSPTPSISFTPSPTPVTNNSIYIDNVTNQFTIAYSPTNVQVVLTGGFANAGLMWIRFEVDFTNLQAASTTNNYVFYIAPLSAIQYGFTQITPSAWSLSGGTITQATVDFSVNSGATWTVGANLALGFNPLLVNGPSVGGGTYANPNWLTDVLEFRVHMVGTVNLSNLVSGHSVLWLLMSRLP